MKRFTLIATILCLCGICQAGFAMSEHKQDMATIQALEKYQKLLSNPVSFGKIMRTAHVYQNGMNQVIEVYKTQKNNVFASLYKYPNKLPVIVVQVNGKTVNKAVVTGNANDIFEAMQQIAITALNPLTHLIDVPPIESKESASVDADVQKTAIVDADISKEEDNATTETIKFYEKLLKNQDSWGPVIKVSHNFAHGMKEIIFKTGNKSRTLYMYKKLPPCLVINNNIKEALIMDGELKAVIDVIEDEIRNEERKSHVATVHNPNRSLQKSARPALPTIHEEARESEQKSVVKEIHPTIAILPKQAQTLPPTIARLSPEPAPISEETSPATIAQLPEPAETLQPTIALLPVELAPQSEETSPATIASLNERPEGAAPRPPSDPEDTPLIETEGCNCRCVNAKTE